MNRRDEALQIEEASIAEIGHRLLEVDDVAWRQEDRAWVIGDLQVDTSGDFLTGTIALEQDHTLLVRDEAAASWAKAEEDTRRGALEGTASPFAIDLREERQWVGLAPSGASFLTFFFGLQGAINETIKRQNWLTRLWEIDPVVSGTRVIEWLRQHPEVKQLIRVVRRPNPVVRDIDKDIQEMRELRARTKHEEWRAYPSDQLRVLGTDDKPTDQLAELIKGLDHTNIDIRIVARGGGAEWRFTAERNVDDAHVADFGGDLLSGMARVLDALRQYSEGREAS